MFLVTATHRLIRSIADTARPHTQLPSRIGIIVANLLRIRPIKMRSLRSLAGPALLLAAVSARAQSPTPSLVLNAMTDEGCFSSAGTMQDQGSYTYQSSGYCQQTCVALGKAVMGTTQGSNCWCGDELPPASAKVGSDQCQSPCNGYNKQNCQCKQCRGPA